MLADQLSWMARHGRALTGCAVVAALLGPAGAARAAQPALAAARPVARMAAPAAVSMKQVSYLGYTFRVPSSWPVIDDADHPRGCVRFDVHAVYLGAPGTNESCPSWLFGTTEAVLIQPGAPGAVRTSAENPTAREVNVTAPRLSLLATFDTDPTEIYQILASASLPAPAISIPNPARLDADSIPPATPMTPMTPTTPGRPRLLTAAASELDAGPAAAPARRHGQQAAAASASSASPSAAGLSAAVAAFRGRGFDSCAAPSSAFMTAWRRSSPYRAVGIYIGGADRACDQHNLSRAWVTRQARAGWHFIPMYAGPQAAFGEVSSPVRQGANAAADAVAQAERLGFGRRTPIYYDMEAYPAQDTGAALRFLSAWTTALHRMGYESGVYSSSRSGIVDLARQYSQHSYAMPDVIYDALWNGSANTADKSFGAGEWVNHQRIHQYSGNVTQTFGHDTIDIDQDFLNVGLPAPRSGTPQASAAVSLPGGAVDVFYQGANGRLWREARSAAGWARPVSMGGADRSVPSAVSAGTGALDVFYEGTGRSLWEVSFRSGPGWGRPRRLTALGQLGGAPRAVAQGNGIVDVFWRGAPKRQLWHARFTPGRGWGRRQLLGAGLASYPSPVEASAGTVEVFWKGNNRGLWLVSSRPGGSWSKPASLGMGPLGGPPHATAQGSGSVEVIWRGTDLHHIWAASGAPGSWRGPVNRGGTVAGSPLPVTADGTVRNVWRGPGGALWVEQRTAKGSWTAPAIVRIGRSVSSAPFTAAGPAGSTLWIFWRGKTGGLWSVSLAAGTSGQPLDLGGRLA